VEEVRRGVSIFSKTTVDVRGMNAGRNILATTVEIVRIIKDLQGRKSVLMIKDNFNQILATAHCIWSVIQS